MIEMGLIVGIGLLVLLVKMNWKWRMRLLSNPVIADVVIFILLTLLHWGTFSGVMVATIGALTCSLVLSLARKLFGCYQNNSYVSGVFDVASKLQ
jgi:presenilin-like A22 family membrane protease